MPVNEQITDSVTQSNVKTIAEAPAEASAMLSKMMAQAAGLSIQNAVANQQASNAILQAVTTMCVNKVINVDPAEALSLVKANTGNDLAASMQALLAALASNQQAAKVAQTTKPAT